MKRKVCALLTGVLLAGTCLSASAAANVMKVNTLENVDLIYNSSLLRMTGNNGYAMGNLEGTALTGEIYGGFDTDCGYVIAYGVDGGLTSRCVLNQEGKEIVPAKYSEIDVKNSNWILALVLKEATADQYDYTSWDDKYYLIETVDVYYVEEGSANCLTTLTRDQYLDAQAYGSYINIQDRTTNAITTYDSQFNVVATDVEYIYDEAVETRDRVTFRENGQEGLQDAEGNVVMAPSFAYIYDFRGDYAEVSTGGSDDLTGLIDKDGNVIVPAEYKSVETNYYLPADAEGETSGYNANGYFAVVNTEGKLGYVDSTGTVTCEPKYSKDIMENNGASALFTDMEGNTRILAADGVETVIEGYDRVSAMYFGSGMYYTVRDADYNTGMIDWHGEVIFPCEYSDIEFAADGQHVLVELNDYTTTEIYQISNDAVAEAAPVEEAEEAAPAEEATAEAAPEEGEASSDNGAVIALIDSAITLLNSEGNNDAVIVLLTDAMNLIGEDNSSAALLLEKTIAQIGEEDVDAAGAISMLESITKLL